MLSGGDKKLIQIFKTFVEKALIPQIKKFQGSLVQWNKFSSLLLLDIPNLNELQLFVDTLPWANNNQKKNQVDILQPKPFEPSKTFGGAKTNNYQFLQTELTESKGNEVLKQRVSQSNNIILTNLEKLLKNLDENQNVIDGLGKDSIQQGKTNKEYVTTYSTNGNIPMASQGYPFSSLNQNPLIHPSVPAQPYSQPHISGFYQKANY